MSVSRVKKIADLERERHAVSRRRGSPVPIAPEQPPVLLPPTRPPAGVNNMAGRRGKGWAKMHKTKTARELPLPPPRATLARRLGVTVHVSPLRLRLEDLMRAHPSPGAQCLEDWLLDVANARGARWVTRWPPASPDFLPLPSAGLSNEDLVTAICQVHNLDRPQMLRAAAQLISMRAVQAETLLAAARRERAELVLAELARQALRVAPEHPVWRALNAALAQMRAPREPLLHWTRLAVPIPDERGCNARGWKLLS